MLVIVKETREVINVKLLSDGSFESQFDNEHHVYKIEELEFADKRNNYVMSKNCRYTPEFY